jgi:uncharacterized membrane protein (UPF0127 family)
MTGSARVVTVLVAACAAAFGLAWYATSQHRTGGGESRAAPAAAGPSVEGRVLVRIGSATLHVEIAADARTQYRGLSGRDVIDPGGGMIFIYPTPRPLTFVMRDCPVPIDIAFLDPDGRVISLHTMQPDPPRRQGEAAAAYEARLRRYPSPLPAQYALETAGGRLRELGLRSGQRVEFDRRALLAELARPPR